MSASAGPLTWKKSMVYGFGQLLSEETSTGTTFIQSDQVGSPNILVESVGGTVVGRAKNLPFGERFGQSGQRSIRRFTNHEDQDGSPIYMQARTYLPAYGKFAQVDPAYDQTKDDPESWNLYNYVTNNPVTHTDPDGRVPTANIEGGVNDEQFYQPLPDASWIANLFAKQKASEKIKEGAPDKSAAKANIDKTAQTGSTSLQSNFSGDLSKYLIEFRRGFYDKRSRS